MIYKHFSVKNPLSGHPSCGMPGVRDCLYLQKGKREAQFHLGGQGDRQCVLEIPPSFPGQGARWCLLSGCALCGKQGSFIRKNCMVCLLSWVVGDPAEMLVRGGTEHNKVQKQDWRKGRGAGGPKADPASSL